VLSSPRTLSDWKVYLLELTTTGAIKVGLVAGIGLPDFVKTNDWMYSRQEIDDMAAAVATTSTSASAIHNKHSPFGPNTPYAATTMPTIRIQGEDFRVVRQSDGQTLVAVHQSVDDSGSMVTSLTRQTEVRRNPLIAAVGKSKKFIVAAVAMDDGSTIPADSRCSKEVQWMVERMIADGL